MDVFLMIASMLGGLALFLYGMNVMSDTLSQMAGGGLDKALGKITKSRFSGFFFGTILTAIVQSSSATTVLTVGFVNGGIMKLKDAVGLIIGANLGTTMTAWILSLNSIEGGGILLQLCKPTTFVPFVALAGFLMMSLSKKEKQRRIGVALVGFAVMMTGMNLMSQAMSPLRDMPAFREILGNLANPLIGFLFSMLFTMLIQSSDATIGILQAIAVGVGITKGMVVPLVCGAQVGSCITAIISSLSSSNNGKRTALLHLYYNLLKTIPFMIIFYALNAALHFEFLSQPVGGVEIPLFHTAINILGAVVYLPLAGLIVKLAEKTIPYSQKEIEERENILTNLDPMLLKNPSVALGQVKVALQTLAGVVDRGYDFYRRQGMTPEEKKEDLKSAAARIFSFCDQIRKYLVEISEKDRDESHFELIERGQNICEAFGKMGAILDAGIGFTERIAEQGKHFSKSALLDMQVIGGAVCELIASTVLSLQTENSSLSETVRLSREQISVLMNRINARHIKRLHNGTCEEALSTPFIDICYNLEKVVDACDTVAHNILGKKGVDSETVAEKAKAIEHLYRDKFQALADDEDEEK